MEWRLLISFRYFWSIWAPPLTNTSIWAPPLTGPYGHLPSLVHMCTSPHWSIWEPPLTGPYGHLPHWSIWAPPPTGPYGHFPSRAPPLTGPYGHLPSLVHMGTSPHWSIWAPPLTGLYGHLPHWSIWAPPPLVHMGTIHMHHNFSPSHPMDCSYLVINHTLTCILILINAYLLLIMKEQGVGIFPQTSYIYAVLIKVTRNSPLSWSPLLPVILL